MNHRNFGSQGQRPQQQLSPGGIDLSQVAVQQRQVSEAIQQHVFDTGAKIFIELVNGIPRPPMGEPISDAMAKHVANIAKSYAPYYAEALGLVKIERASEPIPQSDPDFRG